MHKEVTNLHEVDSHVVVQGLRGVDSESTAECHGRPTGQIVPLLRVVKQEPVMIRQTIATATASLCYQSMRAGFESSDLPLRIRILELCSP